MEKRDKASKRLLAYASPAVVKVKRGLRANGAGRKANVSGAIMRKRKGMGFEAITSD